MSMPLLYLTRDSNEGAACLWLQAGAAVFPVRGDGSKAPCVKKWQTWTPQAGAPSEAWACDSSRMVGLPCGANRLVVIDCDTKNGVDGIAAFRQTCGALGVSLVGVPCVTTPSGGQHFYFTQPLGQPMTNRTGRLPSGIDVRGAKGFVVAAGSILDDGRCYGPVDLTLEEFVRVVACGSEIKGYKLQLLPRDLFEEINGRPTLAARAATVHVLHPGNQAHALNQELSAGISPSWSLAGASDVVARAATGTRNKTLYAQAFAAAMRVRDGLLPQQEVVARLTAAAQAAGLSDEEIANTITSASRGAAQTISFGAASPSISNRIADVTDTGKRRATLKNAKLAIEDLQITARRDLFRDQITLTGNGLPTLYHGALTDHAVTWIRHEVLKRHGFDPRDEYVHSAIKGLAEDNRFNPVTEWLDDLHWDQQNRLTSWFPSIAGADDTEFHRRVGASLFLAMVARARYPGTKYDLCVVLEGPQGSGKSSLVKALAGEEFFTDVPGLLAMDPKTRGELLAGRWIVEIGELSGLSKAETEAVKAAISQTEDHFRAAYERVAVKRPRTFIFVGTTNSQNYLIDATGNRRFVPVACGARIDLSSFAAIRSQLFAEADYYLSQLVDAARKDGYKVIDGQPLPAIFVEAIGLPRHFWANAARAAEERRVIDHGEDLLQAILARKVASPNCRRQPSGAYFIPSTELQGELGLHLGYHPNARALSGWMAKLGWRNARSGRGADQVRGYEVLLHSLDTALRDITSTPTLTLNMSASVTEKPE